MIEKKEEEEEGKKTIQCTQIKKYIDRDKRYDAVKSSSLREDLFDQYVRDLSEDEKRREREKR